MMEGMLWSALSLGFIGSLHCVCMCGPIAVALPKQAKNKFTFIVNRLIYNVGRVLTYVLLGSVCGVVGGIIAMAGFQQVMSIAAGIAIIAALCVPKLTRLLNTDASILKFVNRVGDTWRRLFNSPRALSFLGIGVLNGFLPCGLLYVALVAAATSAGAVQGAEYMLLFGLGTFPAMLLISVMGGLLPLWLRRTASRAIPAGAMLLAVLLVLRGLSLGIPYISPNLNASKPAGASPTAVHDCCK